jgi:hypothetical protein
VKRQRTVECAVVGVAGDPTSPRLVLGLRHADGDHHHFAVTRPIEPDEAGSPIFWQRRGPEELAIRSRWLGRRSEVTSVQYNVAIADSMFTYAPPAGVSVATFHGGDGADVKRALSGRS